MYKAIIVDDEKMIRMGMKQAVDWHAIGIGKVYTAANGQEALGIIEEKKPEIMITDINMAEMSGLDLIACVRKATPLIRIIVLTGYDKFEYARQCLQMNVQDFLLKPIDEKILAETLGNQVRYLEGFRGTEETDPNSRRVQEVAKQIALEENMRNLVHGRIQPGSFFTEAFYRDFPYKKDQGLQVAVIVPPGYVDHLSDEENYAALTIKNICVSLVDLEGDGITFLDDDGNIVIIYFNWGNPSETVDNILKLIGILKDEYNVAMKTAIGSFVTGFHHLAVSYNDAVLLLREKEDDFQEILQGNTAQKKSDLFQEIFLEMKSGMCRNVGDTDCVLRVFERLCKAMDSYNISHKDARRCCYEVASSIYYVYINESGSQTDQRLPSYIKVLQDAGREEACEVTQIFLKKLLDENDQENVNEIIARTKRYIHAHLSEELSVAHLAAAFYLTPNYFSRLFKRAVGEGCNEYIVRKRIEKAKILLETTNLKTNRISDMVGYRDTNYFSIAFKKNVGVSPTKYREQFR